MEACTPATVLSPFTAEVNSSAVDSPQKEPQVSRILSPINNSPPITSLSAEKSPTPEVPSPPPFTNSVAELKDLSLSIAAFYQCYEDLQNHMDSIKAAIFSKMPIPGESLTNTPSRSILDNIASLTPRELCITMLPSSSSPLKDGYTSEIRDDNVSELELFCSTMCSRSIRRYLINNLSDVPKLREEVPKALKLAPNPARLVLECMGKFFLQGTRAYTRDSAMIPAREASVFILECFLLMMGMNGKNMVIIEKAVKEEAMSAAMAWRKRLMNEEGLDRASQVDARGLLLLVACYGIPSSFHREDLRGLMVASKAKEVLPLLHKSQLLMNEITDIVEELMRKKSKIDAVDMAYTFGLEEQFDPQRILLSYLKELQESWKKPKKGSLGSTATLKEALSALKSIRSCLARHKIDPAKLLPGWEINEKISTLGKYIAEQEHNISQKRKEFESLKTQKTKDRKRPRQNDQSPSDHVDSRRNTLPSTNNLLPYPGSSPVIYGGPGAGLIPTGMVPPGGVSSSSGALSMNPYSTGGQVFSRPATQQQYEYYDSALVEKYLSKPQVGLASLYRTPADMTNSSPVVAGTSGGSDPYNFADYVVERESSYINSVPHSVGAMERKSYVSSIPYSDVERESYMNSIGVVGRESYMRSNPHGVGAMPSTLPGEHSTYLYKV